tara:strand:+ start:35004 stop:35621 length:618 start_codon:yes stop_codon:yes gene_type:complete
MNSFNYRGLSLLLVSALIFSCSETKVSAPVPGPAAFAWGKASDRAVSGLSSQGWTLVQDSGDLVILSYPISEDAGINESDLFADAEKPEEPYTIRLYFNQEKLAIARIIRRDISENVDSFEKDIISAFGLKEAAISKGPDSETTEAGNEIKTGERIFETDQYVLKLIRTTIIPAEEKMKGGLNDQLEIEVYPRSENQGISAEALK